MKIIYKSRHSYYTKCKNCRKDIQLSGIKYTNWWTADEPIFNKNGYVIKWKKHKC